MKKTVKAAPKRRPRSKGSEKPSLASIELREVESLRGEIERLRAAGGPPRWNADPDEVRRSVLKLVLTLVEFVRQLLERQAIRRMEVGTLTDDETEAVGLALMRLEETIRDLSTQFGIAPEELNLDLGPIGRLV
ncbi:MAG: gas vesicle protein K [Acidobacteria bacterium]|nr:gas vesicle protein K [Acidobacteriota bacterium]